MVVKLTKRERRALEQTPEWKAERKAAEERWGLGQKEGIRRYDPFLPKNGKIHDAYKAWMGQYEWDLAITLTIKDPTVRWNENTDKGVMLNHYSFTQDWASLTDDEYIDRVEKDTWKKVDKKCYGHAVQRYGKRVQRCGFRQKQIRWGNPHLHLLVKTPDHLTQERFIFILNRYWLGADKLTGITKIEPLWKTYGWADYISQETRTFTGENTFSRWGTTIKGPLDPQD